MKTPPPLVGARPTDWMTRNWKWLVPSLCMFVLVCFAGLLVLILTLVKSSDAYSGAITRAKSSPAVIAVLGSPVVDGLLYTGNITVTGSTGSANLVIPIRGPKGKAKLYVLATKSQNVWHYDKLVVKISETSQQIDISDKPMLPNKSPEPTAVGAGCSALAVHVASRRWLSFLR
jgi:hypothetical protein